jgi:two-component system, sensor histidine kinase PdtaS
MSEQKLVGLERAILWLPKPEQPFAIRFAAATAVMALAIVLQMALALYTSLPGLSLLLAGVFVCAVAFDHGTGIYASILAVIFGYVSFTEGFAHFPTAAGTVAFGLVCFAVAAFGEALRKALERAVQAERTSQILLRELQHRTQNTLNMIVALLELQARGSDIREVKQALSQAASRVRVQAQAYQHLNMRDSERVDAHQYLLEVCRLSEETFSGIRPITVECHAKQTMVSPEKALALGLIANELITNSVKYAFSDAAQGAIKVALDRDEQGHLRLTVRDNGAGCSDDAKPGLGTRLITELVKSHKGSYRRENSKDGCEVTVTLAPKSKHKAAA